MNAELGSTTLGTTDPDSIKSHTAESATHHAQSVSGADLLTVLSAGLASSSSLTTFMTFSRKVLPLRTYL